MRLAIVQVQPSNSSDVMANTVFALIMVLLYEIMIVIIDVMKFLMCKQIAAAASQQRWKDFFQLAGCQRCLCVTISSRRMAFLMHRGPSLEKYHLLLTPIRRFPVQVSPMTACQILMYTTSPLKLSHRHHLAHVAQPDSIFLCSCSVIQHATLNVNQQLAMLVIKRSMQK